MCGYGSFNFYRNIANIPIAYGCEEPSYPEESKKDEGGLVWHVKVIYGGNFQGPVFSYEESAGAVITKLQEEGYWRSS